MRLVRRVGKVLTLEAEAGAGRVRMAMLADLPGQEVAGVELEARLGGGERDRAAARRLEDVDAAAVIHHQVVIVAGAMPQLLVIGVDARADRRRPPEVE